MMFFAGFYAVRANAKILLEAASAMGASTLRTLIVKAVALPVPLNCCESILLKPVPCGLPMYVILCYL